MTGMISSSANPKIKNIIKLKNNPRTRKEQKAFLVEGPRMFFEVPADQLKEVYVTEEFEKKYEDILSGYTYELISEQVCRHISDTRTPQGVLAVAGQDAMTLDQILALEENPLFLLLESLQDPGNLGTIFRTAEGAGVTGIILNRETVDPYNPKVIRSTMGAVFRVPFVLAEDLKDVIGRLQEEGICVYAAHLEGGLFYDEDYSRATGFLIGNEGKGLTGEVTVMADRKIRIPMKGKVESLNAAIAATVLVYEAQRQRGWR